MQSQKINRMISVHFQGKPLIIMVFQIDVPTSNTEEPEVEQLHENWSDLLEPTPIKDVLFITGDWNAKVGSQETPAATGNLGLGVQNEVGQRLIEFCHDNVVVIANTLFHNTKEDFTRGHHQMVNTKFKLIIFFATKDGEALYNHKNKTRS